MKRLAFLAATLVLGAFSMSASMVLTPWTPLYKGIELSIGTNYADASIPRLQVVHCLKVDLSHPDVQLFTTPRASNYQAEFRETLSANITTFVRRYGLKVAVNANFYNATPGASEPSSEGLPCQTYGLLVSEGQTVSVPDTGPDAGGRYATFMFTTNKQPLINFNNRPGWSNTNGVYTGVAGYYPVLSNGVNLASYVVTTYPDPTIHDPQPRTLLGISQDKRYLYMVVIDGRQPGYSDGANDSESAIWMLTFGAWDAINMDGGGSAAMYKADCAGEPVALGHSSYLAQGRSRERYVGSHFGVFSQPLPESIDNVKVVAVDTTANITWTTEQPASGVLEHGPTAAYGKTTVSNGVPVTKHVATLTGLIPNSTNYYRISSWFNGNLLLKECSFITSNSPSGSSVEIFNLSKAWRYNWTNLNGVNWTAANYDDSGWSGPSPALLHVENNVNVVPKSTLLPNNPATPNIPYVTYYFRTHFNLANNPAGGSLTFSNNIDDGAVFYLNGPELYRFRMPAGAISNTTLANGFSCSNFTQGGPYYGDACTNCADVFTVPSAFLTNLVQGDNVLAVEVHNYNATSPDAVFGTAVYFNNPTVQAPKLNVLSSEGHVTLWWNGTGFRLQEGPQLGDNPSWNDSPGPVISSPHIIPSPASTRFYRLRN